MKSLLKILLTIFLSAGGITAGGQNTVPASGGNAGGSGGSVSYSVGQIFYKTNEGPEGSVSEGVQLPFEISVVAAIDDARNFKLISSVYPNPVRDILTLKIEEYEIINLSYKFLDSGGRLLEDKKILSSETAISMSHLAPAIYFIKVTDGKKDIITFKIIKH